jgi:hypothetical protein
MIECGKDKTSFELRFCMQDKPNDLIKYHINKVEIMVVKLMILEVKTIETTISTKPIHSII